MLLVRSILVSRHLMMIEWVTFSNLIVLNQLRHIYETELTHTCKNKKNQKFTATTLSLYLSTPMDKVCITILFSFFFLQLPSMYHSGFWFLCVFWIGREKIRGKQSGGEKNKWRRKERRREKNQSNQKMTRNPRRNLRCQKSC